jgi:hypothetical protein
MGPAIPTVSAQGGQRNFVGRVGVRHAPVPAQRIPGEPRTAGGHIPVRAAFRTAAAADAKAHLRPSSQHGPIISLYNFIRLHTPWRSDQAALPPLRRPLRRPPPRSQVLHRQCRRPAGIRFRGPPKTSPWQGGSDPSTPKQTRPASRPPAALFFSYGLFYRHGLRWGGSCRGLVNAPCTEEIWELIPENPQ